MTNEKKNIQGTPLLQEIFLRFNKSGVVFVDYQKLPLKPRTNGRNISELKQQRRGRLRKRQLKGDIGLLQT